MTPTTDQGKCMDEKPELLPHSVGDCEMLPNVDGRWVTRSSIVRLLDWVTDNDDRDVMLEKIAQLKEIL